MTQTATVNYHVHKPERQAFQLDAGGIIGNLIAPDLAPTDVTVRDARISPAGPSFQDDAVAFASFPTAVSPDQDDTTWQADYEAELTALLTTKLNAQEVIIFDHTVRVDDPDAVRKPARNVHSDYSPDGAEQRLIDILGAEKPRNGALGTMPSSTSGVRLRRRSTPPRLGLSCRRALPRKTGFCSI